MAALIFTVPFAPVAWQRAGVTWTNAGPKHYTPEKTRNWERTVATLAKKAMTPRKCFDAPLVLDLAFSLPIPASWPLWKRQMALQGGIAATSRPDLDNYTKAIKDALNGVVWADDAQVVTLTSSKRYAASPGVAICVTPLPSHPSTLQRKPA